MWSSQARRDFSAKFKPTNISRDDLSREIERTMVVIAQRHYHVWKCTSKGIGRQGVVLKHCSCLQREPVPCRPVPFLCALNTVPLVSVKKHTPFAWALAKQSSGRNCIPAPDLMLRTPILRRVFFFHTCHILSFQPILWNRCFQSKSVKSAQNSPKSISEGGRIWRVWLRRSVFYRHRHVPGLYSVCVDLYL